jgi:hypothetical protein
MAVMPFYYKASIGIGLEILKLLTVDYKLQIYKDFKYTKKETSVMLEENISFYTFTFFFKDPKWVTFFKLKYG